MLLVLFLKCLSWASPATKAKPMLPSKDVLQFLYCLDPTHGYSCPCPWPALTLYSCVALNETAVKRPVSEKPVRSRSSFPQ